MTKLSEYPKARRNIHADNWGESDFTEVKGEYGGPSWDDLAHDCDICLIPAPVADAADAVIDAARTYRETCGEKICSGCCMETVCRSVDALDKLEKVKE